MSTGLLQDRDIVELEQTRRREKRLTAALSADEHAQTVDLSQSLDDETFIEWRQAFFGHLVVYFTHQPNRRVRWRKDQVLIWDKLCAGHKAIPDHIGPAVS